MSSARRSSRVPKMGIIGQDQYGFTRAETMKLFKQEPGSREIAHRIDQQDDVELARNARERRFVFNVSDMQFEMGKGGPTFVDDAWSEIDAHAAARF